MRSIPITDPEGFRAVKSDQVLNRAEAAKYLRVSNAHVSNLVHGKVPGVPRLRCSWLGRRMIFKRSWVDEYLEAIVNEKTAK